MFLFKKVGSYLLGDDPASINEITINSGEFFTYSVTKSKDSILIYTDATLSIKKSTQEHQFQLIVTRIFEEGELESELEKTDDLDEERVFLISENLKFKIEKISSEDTTEPLQIFSWYGLDSRGNTRRYEYLASSKSVSDTFANAFHEALIGCIYEHKNNASFKDATHEDIVKLTEDLAKTNLDEPTASLEDSNASTSKQPNKVSKVVFEVTGDLLKFAEKTNEYFYVAEKVTVWISQEVEVSYNYWITISTGDSDTSEHKTLVCQPIDSEMNPLFSNEKHCFVWNYKQDNKVVSYLLLFPELKDEIEFKSFFTRAIHESLNRQSYDKVPEKEREYHDEFYSSKYEVIVSDSEDDSDEELKEEEEGDDAEETHSSKKDEKSKNSQLAVGYKNDRSYVVRGSIIDVFKHSSPNSLEFTTAINSVSDLKGKNFNPDKVLLHDQDSSMILMNPLDQQTLYRMDLERGKVVEEWKVHDSVPCTSVFGSSKYSQMTPEKTLLGIGPNALYRIDPRINGPNKLVETELKQYLTKQNFSCATTTQKGEIAVASAKGEIKLFDRCGINAKTALPAMGDQIFSLDVSNDGRYIIATCKTYILLVDVLIQSDPQKRLGFAKSFPKTEKPVPKRLQLRPEDVALINQPISFTPARFNSGSDSLEKCIITSTGPYVILWNFRKIKNGNLSSYSLRKYTDNVVADNFQFNQDRSIIVTLPNDVTMTTKGKINTGDTFKPKRNLRSKFDIVNSPY